MMQLELNRTRDKPRSLTERAKGPIDHKAASPARGGWYWQDASQPHQGWLERAESNSRNHGLPAKPRRRHIPIGAHLQDLRRRCGTADEGEGEPLSPCTRHSWYRL